MILIILITLISSLSPSFKSFLLNKIKQSDGEATRIDIRCFISINFILSYFNTSFPGFKSKLN